ncbi:MAG: hypothetical protein MRZ79_12460 [Bacteroidia bacterium]|nr:hypothetical protein [Bacteroidia bacterium]
MKLRYIAIPLTLLLIVAAFVALHLKNQRLQNDFEELLDSTAEKYRELANKFDHAQAQSTSSQEPGTTVRGTQEGKSIPEAISEEDQP